MLNIKYQKPKIKNAYQKLKIYDKKRILILAYIFAVCILQLAAISGCASVKEAAKGIAGVSTKVLEEGRAEAAKQTFPYDYLACYAKTLSILKAQGAYIYARDASKDMVAIYVSQEDTTPVGLFFTKIDKSNTQVEVSSPSKFAKELIAQKIFSGLKEGANPEK